MTAPRREFAEPSAHYRGVRTRDYSVPRNEPIVAPNETGRIAVLKDRLADPSFPPRALLIILRESVPKHAQVFLFEGNFQHSIDEILVVIEFNQCLLE